MIKLCKSDSSKLLTYVKEVMAINYLGGKCKLCGDTNIFHMVFHHRLDVKKECCITELVELRWTKIKPELDKCDLLCSNCHFEFHFINNPLFNEIEMKKCPSKTIYARRNNKRIYLEYKGSIGCTKCGYNKCQASLAFHHINPEEKEFGISKIGKRFRSISELTKEITDELDKCNVLCSNCHLEEHSHVEFFDIHKDFIYEKASNYKEKQSKLDRNLVKSMFESGLSQSEISRRLNVNTSTISRVIVKLKISGVI